MQTSRLIKTKEVSNGYRVAIYEEFTRGRWDYFVYLEEKNLWWWTKVETIGRDITNRVQGFWSLKYAEDEMGEFISRYKQR